MNADQPGRIIQGLRKPFEGQARCVAREQGVRAHPGLQPAVQFLLGSEILEDRLDHEVRRCSPVPFRIRDQAIQYGSRVFRATIEQSAGAPNDRGDLFRPHVLERDPQPVQGTPDGNVSPHHPGTDDMYAGDSLPVRGLTVEFLAKQEYSCQLARLRRLKQIRHGLRFGFKRRSGIFAHALPMLEQPIWSRVVFLRCGRSHAAGIGPCDRVAQGRHTRHPIAP